MSDDVRQIAGFSSYFVEKDGRVWSVRRRRVPKLLKPKESKRDHYLSVGIRNDEGKRIFMTVNVIVLLAFAGPRPKGMVACHNDDNKANNHADNLRWDTPSANLEDAFKNGKFSNPERFACGLKLSSSLAQVIREESNRGASTNSLAERFGVSQRTIKRVVGNIIWKARGKEEFHSKGAAA